MRFSVKCYLPITFSRFAVRLANFYLFTVSGENTVNCLEGFFHSLLTILICSWKIGNKITHEL